MGLHGAQWCIVSRSVFKRNLVWLCGNSVSCCEVLCYKTECVFIAPPISMSGPRGHQLTLQMVRNFIDPRHLTARNFPNSYITSPMSSFLDKAMRVFSRFGEVVSIVDTSAQWWQDDDRDGERTIAVEYGHAASGIAAMNTLNGEDTRSNIDKYHADGEPPRKTNRFVCVPAGSPVMSESCDCVDRKCRALWLLAWRPGASRCGLIPPGSNPPP